MPSKTAFGDLTLYDISGYDINETFMKFRNDIAGITSDSNFSKISTILANHNQEIQNIRKIFDVIADPQAENRYTATIAGLNTYFINLILILSVSQSNTGSSFLKINNLDEVGIKKFDINGSLVDLEENDLTKNIKYFAEFNGQHFIILSPASAKDILAKLKTVHGSGCGLDADLLDGMHATEFATENQGAKAETAIQGIKGNDEIINPDEKMVIIITPENIGASDLSHIHSNATTSTAGFLSTADKTKLDKITTGAVTYGTVEPSGGSSGDLYFRYS